MEKTLEENQPREQAGFRRGYSTMDHIHTLNQVIEKTNEYNIPINIGFIDYEKAFDSIEHFAIFDALRQIGINETYIDIIEDIYTGATAVVSLDEMTSRPFDIKRGVRQGDPISPKKTIDFIANVHNVSTKIESVYLDLFFFQYSHSLSIED